jgi:hypothetical protein
MTSPVGAGQVEEFIAAAPADLDEMVNLERLVLGDDLIA